MVVDKILKFLKIDDNKDVSIDLLNECLGDIEYGILRQLFKKREDKNTLRLSSIGKCLRAQAYTTKGCKKLPLPPRTKITFLQGDILEAIIVLIAKSASVDIREGQLEVDFHGVKGHIDGLVYEEDKEGNVYKYVFECKSMSERSFQMFKDNGMSNTFGYVSQANSYAHALGADGICWVAINKNTGHLHEEIREVDTNLAMDTIYDIDDLRNNMPDAFPRPEPYQETFGRTSKKNPDNRTGNMLIDVKCQYCDYVEICYAGKVTKMHRKGKVKMYLGDVIKGEWTSGGKFYKIGEDND